MTRMKLFLVFSSILFLTPLALAQSFTGPAASGTGGAGRAAIEGSESAIINPATLGYMDRYHMTLPFSEGSHPSEGYSQTYGAILTDGTADKMFPGALAYLKSRDIRGGVESKRQDIHLALADRATKFFAVGLAGHYRTFEQINSVKYNQTNMDLGALLTPLENVGLAFVAYNILSGDEKVPVSIRDVPTFAVGANFIYEEAFAARVDAVRPDKFNPLHRTDLQAGLQMTFMESFAVRGGCNWKETANQTWLTGGLGYIGPRLSFNYAYNQDLRHSEGVRHIVDLWMSF
jgi:hypothetical protein